MFSRGVLAFGHSRVSSAFALAPAVELLPDGVLLRSKVAYRDGTPVEGSSLERTFRVDGDGLDVHEVLRADGGARGLGFSVPAAATVLDDGSSSAGREFRYRLS